MSPPTQLSNVWVWCLAYKIGIFGAGSYSASVVGNHHLDLALTESLERLDKLVY